MIIGLDLSLAATGVAELREPGKVEVFTVTSNAKLKPEARLSRLVQDIELMLPKARLVVLEGLSFGSNDPSAQERSALHWIIRINLHLRQIPYLVVAPSQLKKFCCDSGAAKKEMMIREVYRQWKVEAADNNQADAAALAYVGAAYLGLLSGLRKSQLEVLAKLPKIDVPPGTPANPATSG